jgi:hypothetical protein
MFETSIDANRYVEELITREGLDCEYRRVGHFTAAFKCFIANRAHTRGFRAILREVRKLTDWMVDEAVRGEPVSIILSRAATDLGGANRHKVLLFSRISKIKMRVIAYLEWQ